MLQLFRKNESKCDKSYAKVRTEHIFYIFYTYIVYFDWCAISYTTNSQACASLQRYTAT